MGSGADIGDGVGFFLLVFRFALFLMVNLGFLRSSFPALSLLAMLYLHSRLRLPLL